MSQNYSPACVTLGCSGRAVSLFLCCQLLCFPLDPPVPDLVFGLFSPVSLDLNMELPQGQTGSVGTSVASAEQVNVEFQ